MGNDRSLHPPESRSPPTRSEAMRQATATVNRFRAEAIAHDIGSPFRQSLYIGARMLGASEAEAAAKSKGPLR